MVPYEDQIQYQGWHNEAIIWHAKNIQSKADTVWNSLLVITPWSFYILRPLRGMNLEELNSS